MRLLLLLAVLLLAGAAWSRVAAAKDERPPLRSTLQLDLDRYMGRWWVVGHIPYFAERGKVATADVYALRPDGGITNTYVYRKAFDKPEKQMHGVATVVPGTGNAQWRIAFFGGLVRADYLVMDVASDYSWALIANPKRSLAWIFAREPRMDDEQFKVLAARFGEWGYEPAKIVRVPQVAAAPAVQP
jgi:apolipoprotein D and lipocalin family protein